MDEKQFHVNSLKEHARNLKVLYIKDKTLNSLEMTTLLNKYFKEVDIAIYLDAYKMFIDSYYDLIVTDLDIESKKTTLFYRKIKKIAPRKPMIVVSNIQNHDAIIRLINIGISGFVSLPLNEVHVVNLLSRVTLKIFEDKMFYMLYDNIHTIYENNENVEMSNQLDFNTQTLSKEKKQDSLSDLYEEKPHISALDFMDYYPKDLEATGDKLLEINEKIDIYVNRFVTDPAQNHALAIANAFEQFSEYLSQIREFSNISLATQKLSSLFSDLDFQKSYKDLYDMILVISTGIMNWCEKIFIKAEAENIHYLDKSLLADVLMLESLLYEAATQEDSENEIEFF